MICIKGRAEIKIVGEDVQCSSVRVCCLVLGVFFVALRSHAFSVKETDSLQTKERRVNFLCHLCAQQAAPFICKVGLARKRELVLNRSFPPPAC